MSFKSWRLAILNYCREASATSGYITVERHLETDEVFILMKGKAWLIIGENGEKCGELTVVPMEPNVIYNVRQFAWHGTIMAEDANILLVEEAGTGDSNTVRVNVDEEIRKKLLAQLGI